MNGNYHHTQVGRTVIIAVALALVATGYTGMRAGWHPATLTTIVLCFVCLFLFSSLTVEIEGRQLTAWFGPGLIRRTVELDRIVGARRVRNRWIRGWGIRRLPRGWLWNVSGLNAVEIQFSGGGVFRIGTDDAEGLLAAIEKARR